MANTVIQLKYSSTPGNIPPGLANGEIALNYADGKFYYKNVTGQIVSFSGSGNVYSFATINANGSLITALSNNSILTINPGNNIEISGNIISDVITITANLKPAFDKANSAYTHANDAFIHANNVGYSTNAYSITRFATIENAAAAFYEANLSWEFANSVAYNAAAGFAFANGVNTFAYGVASNAKSAFDNSNGAYTVANSAYNYANTLSSGSGAGGFFNSTLTSFPTGNYGSGEAYAITLLDAFGVSLANTYDCMDPSGRYSLIDLGVLT